MGGMSELEAFFRRLTSLGELDRVDLKALATLGWTRTYLPQGSGLFFPGAVAVIGSGWAAGYRSLSSGRRQLLTLLLPGDFCDYQFLSKPEPRAKRVAVTAVSVWKLPVAAFCAAAETRPPIMSSVLASAAGDKAICEEQIVSLGSRTALERMAHLICELKCRLTKVAMVEPDGRFELPMTQPELGEYLALSSVHVNRTLQSLRHQGLVESSPRHIRILDEEKLALIAHFDPDYLSEVPGLATRFEPQPRRSASNELYDQPAA